MKIIFVKLLLLVNLLLVLAACAPQSVVMIDTQGGTPLHGEFLAIENVLTVYMPNNDVLSGTLSTMQNKTRTYSEQIGNKKKKDKGYTMTSSVSSMQERYGILTSLSSGLSMEITLRYDDSNGSGQGEAIASNGKKYRVQIH